MNPRGIAGIACDRKTLGASWFATGARGRGGPDEGSPYPGIIKEGFGAGTRGTYPNEYPRGSSTNTMRTLGSI